MISCPYCGADNIEGVDECAECGQSLSDMHIRQPSSHVEESLMKDQVHVLGSRDPAAVPPSTPVRDVLKLLADRSIGAILVADESGLVGIFTERDALLKLSVNAAELGDRPVSEFMTASPRTLTNNTKIAFAVQKMDLGGYRHIPIVNEDGGVSGIISVRDILRYLTEKMTVGESR